MSTTIQPIRPWKHLPAPTAPEPAAADPGARAPLRQRLRSTIALLIGRGHRAASSPRVDVPGAIGATDHELVQLSRRPPARTQYEARWSAIEAIRFGGLRPH